MNGTNPYTTTLLAAGNGWVLVVYRNTRPGKVDPGTNRRYGETGQGEPVQLEADRKY